MRVFLAGIIQGSKADPTVHDQTYRELVSAVLQEVDPTVEIVDPHTQHPERFDFTQDQKRAMFIRYVEEAAKCDLVIAYLPEASMGTAVEMWAAHQAGVPVVTVTPMTVNWVVFSLSASVFTDLDQLVAFLRGGGLDTFRAAAR